MLKKIVFVFYLMIAPALQALDNNVVTVDNAWIRPMPIGKNTALYLNITNKGSEVINLIKVKSVISAEIQLHDTQKNGSVLGMHELSSIPCEPGKTTEFKSGHEHIMFIRLKENLKVGQNISITLIFNNEQFDNEQILNVDVPVRMSACDCECE